MTPNSRGERPGPARRASTRRPVALETLEGRALLSHLAPSHVHVHGHAADVTGPRGLPFTTNPHPGPILDVIGNGFAAKSARIYPYYTGQPRVELNVAAATARIVNGGTTLALTGEVVLPIPTKPTGPGQESYYVWGINRGGATSPGPFPDRPQIAFDAVVVVSVQTSGTTGYVKDLNSSAPPTPLDPGSITIDRDTLKLNVPLSLLPPTGAGGAGRYTVNFWAEDAPFPGAASSVESFVPEFRNFAVKVAR